MSSLASCAASGSDTSDSTGSSVGKMISRSRSTVAATEGGGIGEIFLITPVRPIDFVFMRARRIEETLHTTA